MDEDEFDFDRFTIGEEVVYHLVNDEDDSWEGPPVLTGVGTIHHIDRGDPNYPWFVTLPPKHAQLLDNNNWWMKDHSVKPHQFVIEEF